MSLRRFFQTNRNAKAAKAAKADRKSCQWENDRTPSNVTTASTYTDGSDSQDDRMRARNMGILPGRDSVAPPDETESSLTDILAVAETSEVATPRYSKLSGDSSSPHFSFC